MNKLRLILAASILLLAGQVGAAIINAANTDTEYSAGFHADLQGLEWLSLDETMGQSVNSILGGYGGFKDEQWRYANRKETAILLNSISGGVSGYSNTMVFLLPPDIEKKLKSGKDGGVKMEITVHR